MTMNLIELIPKVLVFAVCGLILLISVISILAMKKTDISLAKEMIRRSGKKHFGSRVAFYCTVLYCGVGFWFGAKDITFYFLLSATLAEKLITYRICRSNKDWLGRFLTKIGW